MSTAKKSTPLSHEVGDEGDVAREPVEFGDHQRRLVKSTGGQGLGELCPVRPFSTLDFRELAAKPSSPAFRVCGERSAAPPCQRPERRCPNHVAIWSPRPPPLAVGTVGNATEDFHGEERAALPWCPSRMLPLPGASPRAESRCRTSWLLVCVRRDHVGRPTHVDVGHSDVRPGRTDRSDHRPTRTECLPSGNPPDAISEAVGEAVARNEHASGHHAASEWRGGSIHP